MEKYLALKASAGSGKTFALTVRYITLLLLDARPNEILTLTFTNKAANEMSERIYHTLLNLGKDEAYLDAIIKQSNLTKEKILELKPKLIKKFINSELSIFTLDKFINKILREFCGYLNINDDFLIKNDNSDELTLKFLQSLNQDDLNNFIDFFLFENKKFNSLFELFKILIEKNETFKEIDIDKNLILLQEQEVLKWAFKIKEEVENASGASNSALRSVDFSDFSSLLDKGKTWLTKNTIFEFSYFKKFVTQTMQDCFENLKKELQIYYKIRSNYSLSSLIRLFLIFHKFRTNYIKNKNYLEFNDISNFVYELLQEKIDKEFLYFRLDSKYSHLLIDEFQDTSLLQYKILEPMITEIVSGFGTQFKTFFYVGDTKQSIYRFRGGKRELFDYVAESNPTIQIEVLETNYRSCKEVVEFVNSCFSTLPNYEYDKQKYIKNEGYVKVLEDSFEEDPFLKIFENVQNLLNLGVNPNDIAILTYTNDDVLEIFTYLQEKLPNIKISTEMTSKLINQANVKAVINAVKYLYFKEDIYKANCNSILGVELSSHLEFSDTLLNENMPFIINIVAKKLKLLDENVISLVELSSSYKNIVDFIYEIDFLEASILNKEQQGIQILTIFKSKGLEFDTVLLLDRIKRKNSDKSSLLFEYDNVNLKSIYYKVPNLENFDDNYKIALEKEKKLSLDDEINILYVALTRAKSNLIIFKKEKNSVFDILSLTPCEIGKILIKNSDVQKTISLAPIKYKPLNLGKQELKINKSKYETEYSLHSKYFGLGTHYCLEMMKNFDIQSLKLSINLAKSKYNSHLCNNDFEEIKKRITLLIKDEFFQSIIKDSFYSKEQSLLYKNELKIIDLLVFKDNKYYIFDYKTTLNEEESHLLQVNYYKKAIKEITSNIEVEGFVVYLNSNNIVFKKVN